MKNFICGFIIGAMLFGSIGTFAAYYIVKPAEFKVFVNGKEYNSDPPALDLNGKAYLPIRSLGEVLGVPVKWNEFLRQVEIGAETQVGNSENNDSQKLATGLLNNFPNLKVVPSSSDILDKNKTEDDFDGDGKKEILNIDVKHELTNKDEVNKPLSIRLIINNKEITYEDPWNDGVQIYITDFNYEDKYKDICIFHMNTDVSFYTTIYRYDGTEIYEYAKFNHYSSLLYYDEKGKIYFYDVKPTEGYYKYFDYVNKNIKSIAL